jgi:hypothetical protein
MTSPASALAVAETIKLSTNLTVKRYRDLERKAQRRALAEFIFIRLSERYIEPVSSGAKNGFAMMACGCLLIETIESFYAGWKTTQKDGRSRRATKQFFNRSERFSDFRGLEDAFYRNVRCSILHQGETRSGWRITRDREVPVFVRNKKLINATKFINRLSYALSDYRGELERAEWDQVIWQNFRQKMDAVIANCEGEAHA